MLSSLSTLAMLLNLSYMCYTHGKISFYFYGQINTQAHILLSGRKSKFIFTNSTRPNPPTPRVSMMLKSDRCRLKKNAFSASCLHDTKRRNGKRLEEFTRKEKRAGVENFSSLSFNTRDQGFISSHFCTNSGPSINPFN